MRLLPQADLPHINLPETVGTQGTQNLSTLNKLRRLARKFRAQLLTGNET